MTSQSMSSIRGRLGSVVGAVALAIVSCGGQQGGGGADPGADPSAPPPAPQDVQVAMILCMREAGFTEYGDGRLDASAQQALIEHPDFPAAYERCEKESGLIDHVPASAGDGLEHIDTEAQERRTLMLVDCLRARGWDVDVQRERGHVLPGVPDIADDEQWDAFDLDMRACVEDARIPVHEDHDHGSHDHAPVEQRPGDDVGTGG